MSVIAEVEKVLRSIAPSGTRQPIRVLVRNAPQLGANALALPDGTIVVTDAMLRHILGKGNEFDLEKASQLAGVLAQKSATSSSATACASWPVRR